MPDRSAIVEAIAAARLAAFDARWGVGSGSLKTFREQVSCDLEALAGLGMVVVSAEDYRRAVAPVDKGEFVKWAAEVFTNQGKAVVSVEDLRTAFGYWRRPATNFHGAQDAYDRLRAALTERIDP